jgi:hypothetical protein
MVTIRFLASPNIERAAAAQANGGLGLALYHVGHSALAGIGHTLPAEVEKKLTQPPSIRAWDFLSIATAVYGVDRFILRRNSPDGWTRIISLDIEVVEPDPWSALATQVAEMLRFISGDIWYVSFRGGGQNPPNFSPRLTDRDCTCLFSGGLDSLIGAIDLLSAGRQPFLVSQAFPKEGPVQEYLAGQIGMREYRFDGHARERATEPYELSSRTRSLLFFAYGALAAEKLGGELFVPENGLISINPPLTRRRIGSLSTRTTHPHLVRSVQEILDRVGLMVTIINPYTYKTKGEMLRQCTDPVKIARIASCSYSCGRGKRKNMHCGRCIPCLIRRAAFLKAGIADSTHYFAENLAQYAKNDDVFAARLAVAKFAHRDMTRWATEAGPLPSDPTLRAAHVDVVKRGLEELREFLETFNWP